MNENFELNSYDNDYKDLLDEMKAYLKALEKLYNEDPEKAREVAKKALIRMCVLDKNGEEKASIVNESQYTVKEKIPTYQAFCYLIHLYDKIGNNLYWCPQNKLNKMLLLSVLEYYKKYDYVFTSDLEILKEEENGYIIDTRYKYLRAPITFSNKTKNERLPMDVAEKLYGYKEPLGILYFDEDDFFYCPKIKDTLINTFIDYASCDYNTVSNAVNNFKDVNEEVFSKVINKCYKEKKN